MRIVADTNVLVSALLAPGGGSGARLAAVDSGEVTLVATPGLLDELEEVLAHGACPTISHRPRLVASAVLTSTNSG